MKQPDPFQHELRARVASQKAHNFPIIVAAPPGSGKTFAAIHAARGIGCSLIMAPSRGVANHFAKECELEGEEFRLALSKNDLPADPSHPWDGILITTKHAVFAAFQQSFGRTEAGHYRLRDPDVRHGFIEVCRATTFDLLVIDEVHHFAGEETLHNAALRFLSSRAKSRVGMSGTPTTNRPEDMAVILRGLGLRASHPMAHPSVWAPKPGVLSARALSFFTEHCLIKGGAPKLEPFVVQHVRVTPRLDSFTRKRYNAAVQTASKTKNSNELMGSFQTLIQIAIDQKMETVQTMIDDCNDEPIIVVSPFCEPLERLAGPKSVLYTGRISPKEREANLNSFIHGDASRFLLSLKAGAEGLDGLQHRASRMIIIAPPWTAAALSQTIARLHRRGQKHIVQVSLMICTGTIDESLIALIESKQRGMDALLAGSSEDDVAWRFGRGLRASIRPIS